VNVSAAFQELKTKQYKLTGKQRLMVLGAIGIIGMIIFFYTTTSEVEVAVQSNPPSTASQGADKTLNKTGNQINQTALIMRDPFAAPPQLYENKNQIAPIMPSNLPSDVPRSVPKSVIPNMTYGNLTLTGIVGNAGQRLAVIRSADKSKSYGLNDFIGADKIVAITNDYVILASDDRKLVLRLETSGQKGGNHSER